VLRELSSFHRRRLLTCVSSCILSSKSKQDNATSDMLANLADLGMLNTTTSPMASNNNTEAGAGGNNAYNSQQSASQLFGARNLTRSGETQDTEESADERGG
jgi:hypothetical protein